MGAKGTAFCSIEEQETVIRYGRTKDYAEPSVISQKNKDKPW